MMSILSEDLVEEILSRVPATSLKKLRCTCKQWNSLFNDHRFSKKHFERAPKEFLVLMRFTFKVYSAIFDLRGIRSKIDPSIEVKGEFGLLGSSLISHCNGLLLCRERTMDYGRKLRVYNPCTGQTRSIDLRTDNRKFEWFSLGYKNNKSSSASYKILTFDCCADNFFAELQIYEFSSNSWRIFDDVNPDDWRLPLRRRRGVSLKGNTYWIASDTRNAYHGFCCDIFLLKFDFTEERFQRLCLPLNCDACDFNTMVLSTVREEKLAFLVQSEFESTMEIWLTKKIIFDMSNDMSWRKLFRVDLGYNMFKNSMSFMVDEENKVAVCCDRDKGDDYRTTSRMFIVGEDKFRQMDLSGDSAIRPTPWVSEPYFLSYVPSLIQF
ncbi:hypothetical protein EUTSA_v10026986mg [Eutrema salsugineum]|uniref:F-box domain-containing protein n=1 Tax=Eutrema salsugineum TaxID=72664 RepID=V4P903_EUTSA|nr:putative F-box/kelch-repeat protein At1g62270 [Eutrema salsugineum]ESQ56116.1 hypothetical protein EUTSA_v10026986mg [Eutrema salsugineum]